MRKIMAEAERRRVPKFAFGHAQKLVNIYLKTTLDWSLGVPGGSA